MDFVDIGSLMYGFYRKQGEAQLDDRQLTPGQIADAIDSDGCHGFDDYGRLIGPGEKGADEIKAGALKAVADTYQAYLLTDFEVTDVEHHIERFFDNDLSIGRYGWTHENLPEFGRPAPITQPRPKTRGPSVNTQVVLFDGLIRLANEKTDFVFDLNWLFEKAGYSDLQAHGELEKLNRALEVKTGRKLKADTLKKLLEQLGRR